ncbi:MAG: zinc ribbon domain-containing protein [Elusimicrobia bacterium]|nr:zinc ribbon domain-containing protein [Elusimicrobiota bacterium]MDE2237734.1 zinc ribbon domain-containing protein [Elusimicrobiota bacterium]MDE2424890.1 zinc ribbon domain-containing protein [Elusimicrobiota bacterium]
MKCMNCGQQNKETVKACRKCGRDLAVPPAWFPDAAWHLKTLGIIYAALIVFYLGVSAALKQLPKPYNIRKIPVELTPWLRHGRTYLPEDELKPPAHAAEPAH